MFVSLLLIESLELVLVDWGWGEEEDSWVLGLGCRMGDYVFEIGFEYWDGGVLGCAGETGVIGAEEYCLFVSTVVRML